MLEQNYEDLDSIPDGYTHLYVESEAGYTLRSATDIKTVADTTALQEALKKERNDRKLLRDQLNTFEGIDPVDVQAQRDELETLRASATPNVTVDEQVASRLNAKTAPLQRQIDKLNEELAAREETINHFETTSKKAKITSTVQQALTDSKIRQEAINELLSTAAFIFDIDSDTGEVVTKDGLANVPVGLSPEAWLAEKKTTSPYLWPESQGANAQGSGDSYVSGTNPFAKETWNMTAATQLRKTNPERAQKLAAAAGYKL